MKRVVVKVTNNSDLEVAKDSILDQFGYLIFVDKFRSFSIVTFDVPEENEETALSDIRSLGHQATWDMEVTCDPAETVESATVQHEDESLNEAAADASYGTRNITTVGTGTIYVRVANIGGSNFYTFSQTAGGTYSRYLNYSGFLQGGTYTFDTSHSSNSGHPFRFSDTPDGTYTTGGTQLTTGVTVAGTPGTVGSYTRIVVGTSTPSILFYYCTVHPGMGRFQASPDLYGTINIHDFWHLDRITKSDRSYLNGQFSYTETGDGVDIYIIDSGVRGASRPTGTNAALHPELYDPDFVTNLNGTAEQQNYRVYQLPHYAGAYGTNNEDDNGHGTFCAIMSAGRTAGVSRKSRIYSLKAFNSGLSSAYSQILAAYQAVIDHNDPSDANYKGNNRPAIINASFGPTIPSGSYPYIELNDSGTDVGVEVELLDEIEKTVTDTYNIILARSAGNGFTDASSNFAGPIQGKYIAGTRTAGYSDPVFNSVDPNQNKISVGATEFNDRWAYFSNYGGGVTTTAPGARLVSPKYDWTSNTTYTSTGNYDVISGTSFSCPIVAGILASWVSSNSYTRTTSSLPQLSKAFVRGDGSGFLKNGSGTSTYPINSIEEKALPTNPFSVSNGSSDLVIKFNSADSAHFIGNVGKKVQLRVVSATTVGGVNIVQQATQWMTITTESAVNNTLTVTMASSGTSTQSNAGGSGHYLAIVTGTHEATDGPEFSGTQLYTQTDAQETAGTSTAIKNIPVDPGVDFNLASLGTTSRGALYPYVDSVITWSSSSGSLSGTPFANGASVNLSLGLSSLTTWASEPITIQGYTLSGTSISGTGLTFNTTTGVLSGTITASYQDLTYNITVTETTTGQSQNYNFTITGTGVAITVTTQPSNASIEAGGGINATFTAAGTADDASTVTFQWQRSTNGGSTWSDITSLAGHSGETTGTLTVDDDFAFNSNQYRCVLDSATAVNPTTTNAATLTVYRVVTIGTQPTNQTPVAPATATFFVTASTADSATVTYQWEKSSDGTIYSTISGATSASYTTGATSYDVDFGDYYRCVCSATGVLASVTSSPAQLLLTRTINITTQPANVTGAVGGTVQFSVVATTSDNDAGDITYQWQFSINAGTSWSNVVGGSGATTATYTTPALTASNDEQRYRCVLSCAGATSINSGSATLQVETVTPVVTQQPTNQTVNENATATFTCLGDVTMGQIGANAASSSFDVEDFETPSAGGGNSIDPYSVVLQSQHEPSVTYQWQKSDDGGSNWGDITGATSPSYTTGTLSYASDNGDRYRCKINAVGAAAPAYTNSATLTVLRTFTITANPINQTGNETATSTFAVSVSASSGAPSYQWQRSDDGGANYSNISGATNSTYTTPQLTYAQDNNDRYRCVVSLVGSAGSQTSTFALLTVLRVIAITTQPQSVAVIEGSTATFTVIATITSDVISYQWQVSTNSGSSWSNINGANSSSYTTVPTVYPTTPNTQYRCILSNVGATTVASAVATLTVNEAEFVSAPTTVTVTIDPDTLRTFARTPLITTSAFVSQYTGSTHYSSFWRIRRVSDNTIIYDTASIFAGGDTGNLTTFTVPSGVLSFDTVYSVQVKFRDQNGLESAYTAAQNFTTPFVDQPVIQTIVPAFNPTINVNPAEVKAGYAHTSSDWQFSPTNQFLTIIHQSLGNTANKTQYILPQDVSLDPNTTYYVRIRFNVNQV
jgi:hypothetical protein